jgi:hypothetical protein
MTARHKPEPTPKPSAKRVRKKPVKAAARKPPKVKGRFIKVFIKDLPPPSPLRGFVPTTPEIEELVIQTLDGRAAAESYKQLLRDNYKMMYYFGGHPVLYRQTDQGKEIVAAGTEEIGRVLRKRMSAAERETLMLGHAEVWPYGEPSDTRFKPSTS